MLRAKGLVVSSFFRPVSHKVISCSDLLPPLSPSLRSGGFLFDSLYRLSISRLSPRAPRFIFLPGYGLFSFISLWYFSIVLHQDASRSPFRSLRPSSRIFTAAFTSRSIQFPHPQRYTRSSSRSSSFTFPQQLHFLLDGKNRPTLTSTFPRSESL